VPSNALPPTVDELLDVAAGGVQSKHDVADARDGSRYDVWNGVGAILFSRIANRARGNFRNVYFDTAEGAALDDIVDRRYPNIDPRVESTAGTGTVTLRRATDAAGAGTIHEGMRIALTGPGASGIRYYEIAADYPVSATALEVIPTIRAYVSGTGQSANANSVDDRLLIEDSIFDPTFLPLRLVCSEGEDQELDQELQARVRTDRIESRAGYETFIKKTMRDAGAIVVECFASGYLGDALDFGLNKIYVADASYNTPAELLSACRLAAFDCVALGMAPQVLSLQSSPLVVRLTLTLWNPLGAASRDGIKASVISRVLDYISSNPYVWSVSAIEGAARGATSDVSDVSATASVAAPNVATIFNASTLTRWTLSTEDCIVDF
jgi:hypothetical protein